MRGVPLRVEIGPKDMEKEQCCIARSRRRSSGWCRPGGPCGRASCTPRSRGPPPLIPESLLQKEKDHVEGFAPECAWVTYGGSEKLEERYWSVFRPRVTGMAR